MFNRLAYVLLIISFTFGQKARMAVLDFSIEGHIRENAVKAIINGVEKEIKSLGKYYVEPRSIVIPTIQKTGYTAKTCNIECIKRI